MRKLSILSLFILSFKVLSEDPFAAQNFDQPLREIAVIATHEGFYPQSLSVFKGEKVRFYLTSTANIDKCFMINQKEVFVPVRRGEVTEVEVHFDREETIGFHCPVGAMKGRISVLEHPTERALRLRTRELASEKSRVKVWMPREE